LGYNWGMREIHIVAGPTASGKTKFAIELAKKINGELINADARQVYKYLDIGTNKGKVMETESKIKDLDHPVFDIEGSGVSIHLLSFLSPDQDFSSFDYQQEVFRLLPKIWKMSKTPVIVGGTGLYINYILHPEMYDTPASIDTKLREELDILSVIELQKRLKSLDPEIEVKMNNSDWNNSRRLTRKIEILTNKLSEEILYSRPKTLQEVFNLDSEPSIHYLQPELLELKERIDKRVLEMWSEGLVDEVKKVIGMGFSKECRALQGIGYREVIQYLDGKIDERTCIQMIQRAHLQYAKRQITWFKKYLN